MDLPQRVICLIPETALRLFVQPNDFFGLGKDQVHIIMGGSKGCADGLTKTNWNFFVSPLPPLRVMKSTPPTSFTSAARLLRASSLVLASLSITDSFSSSGASTIPADERDHVAESGQNVHRTATRALRRREIDFQLHRVERFLKFSRRKLPDDDAAFVAQEFRLITVDSSIEAAPAFGIAEVGMGDRCADDFHMVQKGDSFPPHSSTARVNALAKRRPYST